MRRTLPRNRVAAQWRRTLRVPVACRPGGRFGAIAALRCRLPRGHSSGRRRATVREPLGDTACRVQAGQRLALARRRCCSACAEARQHPWQHPDRPMRPCHPREGTIRTIWPDSDGYDTRVTRLRAWSRLTGWRFESSSAHRKALHSGAFRVPGLDCRGRRPKPWQRYWQHPHAAPAPTDDRRTTTGQIRLCSVFVRLSGAV
jgi:hypothetical protein